MFDLSIIVPAVGSQADLDDTLLSVLENRPVGCEVLVPHSPAYRDPYGLDDEVRFVPTDLRGLAGQLNAGIAASQAALIHVLLPGAVAESGWTLAAMEAFKACPELGAAAPRLMQRERPDRLAAVGLCYTPSGRKQIVGLGRRWRPSRRAYQIDGPTLQAAFLRRTTMEAIGWLTNRFGDEHIDTDYAARLRAHAVPCQVIDESVVTGPIPKRGRGFRAARSAESLFRVHSGSTPRHALHVAGDIARQIPSPACLGSLCGRVLGWLAPTRPLEDEIPKKASLSTDPRATMIKLPSSNSQQGTNSSASYSKSA